jgi:hypothetical protein
LRKGLGNALSRLAWNHPSGLREQCLASKLGMTRLTVSMKVFNTIECELGNGVQPKDAA